MQVSTGYRRGRKAEEGSKREDLSCQAWQREPGVTAGEGTVLSKPGMPVGTVVSGETTLNLASPELR